MNQDHARTGRVCTRKPNPHRKGECAQPSMCPNAEYFVRVGDLKEQTGQFGLPPILRCPRCCLEVSANQSDYFMFSDDHIFTCEKCKVFLELVTRRVVFERVDLPGTCIGCVGLSHEQPCPLWVLPL